MLFAATDPLLARWTAPVVEDAAPGRKLARTR